MSPQSLSPPGDACQPPAFSCSTRTWLWGISEVYFIWFQICFHTFQSALSTEHLWLSGTPLQGPFWKDFAWSTDFANVVIHAKPWSCAYSCENQWHSVNICFILNILWSDIMTEKLLCVNRLRIVKSYTKKQHPHSSLLPSLEKFFLSLSGITIYCGIFQLLHF